MADNFQGTCHCGESTYRLSGRPLFTHACHCYDCQKRTGSAFGITTFILRREFECLSGAEKAFEVSANSTQFSCSTCDTRIYRVSKNFPESLIINPSTLEDLDIGTPDAHIWTKRKRPWLTLDAGIPQFDEEYETNDVWPQESLQRLERIQSGQS